MKHIFQLTRAFLAPLLLLSMTAVAFCEWNDPVRDQIKSDTLVVAENDTVTFEIFETSDVLTFQFIALGSGTVSAKYRAYDRAASIHRSGSGESVAFLKADGTTTTSLTVASGECFTMLIDPLGLEYQQIILTGSGTIPYMLLCTQRNQQ